MLSRIRLLVLLTLIGMSSHAQSRYRFFTLGVEQGLTSDFAWSVCQDKYNYIWIGTQNGLNRYDGHSIRQYFHNPTDSFSLPDNSIYWMHKSGDGELWFAVGYGGVVRYDYANDRFERFRPFENLRTAAKEKIPVWRIGNDAAGRLYFASSGACFRYNKQTGKMEDLTPLFKGGIDGYGVAMFIPQGKDLLWILTGNGLFRYDLVKNEIRQMPFDKEKMGFGTQTMHDAEWINDHELVVAVVRTGFVLFDTRTETFRMPPAPFDPTTTKQFSETGGVQKDSKGRIWLANSRYGLLEYLPSRNATYTLKKEPSYPYPYSEQEGKGMNVYEDNDGNIWYCSSGKGVIWFKPDMDFIQVYQRDFSKEATLPDNVVNSFLPLDKDRMLIGTNKGLVVYNVSRNTFNVLPTAVTDKDVHPHPLTRTMMQSGDSVFIATLNALSIYDKKEGRFSRYVINNKSADSIFPYGQWLVHRLSPQEVIVSGQHFTRFNLATKQYVYSNPRQPDPLYNLRDINASFFDERSKTLWAEAGIGRLYSYQTTSKKLQEHRYTNDSVQMIDAIVVDDKGLVLLGTSNGFYQYDPVNNEGRRIDLNTVRREVYNIAVQNQEWLWLSTPKEIVRYNRNTKKTQILTVSSFLPNAEILKRAFYLDPSGWLWIGTNKGFSRLEIGRFHIKSFFKEPQLVRFSVFDQPKTFSQPFSHLDRIELASNENFFSFGLSSFSYMGSGTYSYMLEGLHKDWHMAANNTGSYTNVPPGTYRLRIRSAKESGGWIEKGKPVIIVVQSPFWQTWWFITLLAFIAALAIAGLYRFYSKRKKKKQVDDTIDYFANSNYGENSVTEICWDIARNCISQLKLEDCVVYLLDEKRNVLVQKAAYGPKNPKEHEIIDPIEIRPGEGIVGAAASMGKPVVVKDTTKDNRYIVDDAKRLSELAVPIIHEGRAIGVIDSEHSKKSFFTSEHVKALSTIAAISANKIAEANAEEAARQSEIALLEIKKLLAESQLMALRAQMNPHFVFNCLNSIQECIVMQKYGEASLYLNKFSKLFRSVLNNSSKLMVSLAEEIEVLELYLALEHMRFEQSFQFTIHVGEDLETEEILLPSMLLQPFVENALWHGLMHKEGDRMLAICFEKIADDVFQCMIDDNGIGRKKALELKEQQSKTKRHVSKGMRICNDRIELLQKQGHHAQLNITDKYGPGGEAQGTKVVLELSSFLT